MSSHGNLSQPATMPPPYARVLAVPPPPAPATALGSAAVEYDQFDNPRPAARFRNLFCSNLPSGVDEAALLGLFAGLGATGARVSEVPPPHRTAVAGASTSGGKRFGFVFFESEASGKRAHTVVVARRAAGTLPLPVDVFPSRHTTKFLRRRFRHGAKTMKPSSGLLIGASGMHSATHSSRVSDCSTDVSISGSSTRGHCGGGGSGCRNSAAAAFPVPVDGPSSQSADDFDNGVCCHLTEIEPRPLHPNVLGQQPLPRRQRTVLPLSVLHRVNHHHQAYPQHTYSLLDENNIPSGDDSLDGVSAPRIVCRTHHGDESFPFTNKSTLTTRKAPVVATMRQTPPSLSANVEGSAVIVSAPVAPGGQVSYRRRSNPYSACGVDYMYI